MTRTPEAKRATALLMRVAPDHADRLRNPVRYWDQYTSGCDARAALSIACGAPLGKINPARGTHAVVVQEWESKDEPTRCANTSPALTSTSDTTERRLW